MTNDIDNRIGKLFVVNKNVLSHSEYNNWVIITNKKGNWITLVTYAGIQYKNNLGDRNFIFLGVEHNSCSAQVMHKFLFGHIVVQTYIGILFLKECEQLTY